MPPKTPLQHMPTDAIISKSLEVASKIRDQELAVKALRDDLEGRWDEDRDGSNHPGINDRVADTEKVILRLERDLLAQKSLLASQLKVQADTSNRLADGERLLAQYHRDYADLLTSAINGFPV